MLERIPPRCARSPSPARHLPPARTARPRAPEYDAETPTGPGTATYSPQLYLTPPRGAPLPPPATWYGAAPGSRAPRLCISFLQSSGPAHSTNSDRRRPFLKLGQHTRDPGAGPESCTTMRGSMGVSLSPRKLIPAPWKIARRSLFSAAQRSTWCRQVVLVSGAWFGAAGSSTQLVRAGPRGHLLMAGSSRCNCFTRKPAWRYRRRADAGLRWRGTGRGGDARALDPAGRG